MAKRIVRATSLALVVVAAACGSEESLPTIAVTFDPATARATYRGGGQSFNLPIVNVDLTLQPSPSSGGGVVIVEDAPVLYFNPLSYLWRNADGTYSAGLIFDPALPGGTYAGTLTLVLCEDAGCGSRYPMSGNVLPYELTVADPISVTAWANGVPVSAASTIPVRSGALVRIESSEPATYSVYTGGASAWNRIETATSWEAELRYSVSTPGSTGYLDVEVFALAEPQGSTTVTFAVTE